MSLANVAPYLILNKTSADEVLRRAQDQFQDINHNKGCQIAEQGMNIIIYAPISLSFHITLS